MIVWALEIFDCTRIWNPKLAYTIDRMHVTSVTHYHLRLEPFFFYLDHFSSPYTL